MKREERREIKARMIAGETIEEILQDAKFQGRTDEVGKVAKEYFRISLAMKGMPYQEVARRELLAQGITEPAPERVKAICNAISVMISTEKLGATLKEKLDEIQRRLEEGQEVRDIVADQKLNVCNEAVAFVQEKVAKKEAKEVKESKKRKPAEKTPKTRKRATTEERSIILAQILLGKSAEEMGQMNELKELSLEGIQKICTEKAWIVPAMQLVSYERLREIMGITRTNVYSACNQTKVNGQTISKMRFEKTKKLEKRLQEKGENESVETIAQELDVDIIVAKELLAYLQTEQEQAKKPVQLTKDEQERVLILTIAGTSVEEICQMEEFQKYPKELLETLVKERAWMIQVARVVDYGKIAEETGKAKPNLRTMANQRTLQGIRIAQIRAEKKEALQQRLQNRQGESLEDLARELQMDLEAVQEAATKWQEKSKKSGMKIQRREDSIAVVEQMLLGKTPEEIAKMEEFQRYSQESICQVCQAKAWMKQYLRMISLTKIAEELGIHKSQMYKDCREYRLNGKSLAQIHTEKEAQIRQELSQNANLEELAQQYEVDFQVLQDWQQEKKTEEIGKKQVRGSSQEEKEKILEQMLEGKKVEDILAMEAFQAYSEEAMQTFYREKAWLLLAVRLVPIETIAEAVRRQVTTIRSLCSNVTYQGKRITQIRQEKMAQLQIVLKQGREPVEVIAKKLNVDLAVATEVQEQVAQQQKAQEEKQKELERKEQEKAERLAAKKQAKTTRIAKHREPVPIPSKPVPVSTPTPKVQVLPQERTRAERKQAVQKNSAYLRMRIMQGKYNSRRKGGVKKPEENTVAMAQSEQEKMVIERALVSIEKKVADAEKDLSKAERKSIMQAMYQEVKAIEKFTLNSVQAERLRKAMNGKAIDLYMRSCGPEPHARMVRMQAMADRKMMGAIEKEIEQTEDLERLRSFSIQLTTIKGENSFIRERLSSIVYRKMAKVREAQAIYRLQHEVPQEVEQIVAGLATGKLDVAQANAVIATLAEQKVAGNLSKSRFALTQEQQKRQIQIQIRNVLAKQAERFPIERPEVTLQLLQELGMQEAMLNVKAITDNQVGQKKFAEAKAFCNVYGKVENDEARKGFYGIRNSIRNAEIGDLVLRGIQGQVSLEGAAQFWKTLETGIRMGNVNLSQVILGKTEDGTKDITLEDIWPDGKGQRQK